MICAGICGLEVRNNLRPAQNANEGTGTDTMTQFTELATVREMMAAHALEPIPPNPWHPNTNWSMVHHRIQYSKENQKPCLCMQCKVYLDSVGLKLV